MVHETLPASTAPAPAARGGALLAGLGIGALALFFAWSDSSQNAWAAGALIAAVVVDGLGRIAGRIALRRNTAPQGGALPSVVFPSIILASERGLVAVALLFGAVMMVWQDGFAVLASLFAGLLAMGGIARLAIARVVMGRETRDDDPEA